MKLKTLNIYNAYIPEGDCHFSITINAKSVELTIARCNFDGNQRAIQANGYYILIKANITETTFLNSNVAIGIIMANTNSNISITDCTFSSISDSVLYLFSHNSLSLKINSCSFHNNSAGAGCIDGCGAIILLIDGMSNISS